MLELVDVEHAYGDQPVLRGVTLTLAEGRIGCILGPSGCGKTTLLRCIAGFEQLSAGTIRAGGELLSAPDRHVPAERRRIGMVFQDYALLPHLSAQRNIEFALHEKPAKEAQRIAASFLDRVGLAGLGERFPHELSGGQQQRVAIARALAPEPRLLLMDEPFSNLDMSMRQTLGRELRELFRQLGTTVLVAMHDHHDAFALADDAGVLHHGELLQWDTAYELYHRPQSRFVARFVGKGVWLPGRINSDGTVDSELGTISGGLKERFPTGTRVELLLRPDDVVHDDDSSMTAEVVTRLFQGSEFLYELRTDTGTQLLSSVRSHHNHPVGQKIGIRLETDHIVVFPVE